jgi:UDP-N-acetylmuramoylalanine--D-glutamate ligase
MAAILAAKRFQVKNEDIRDALSSFKGVEHRLEHVLSLNGIQYVNDSKATNINSAWFALSSYKKPIVWIAGGKSSGNDYSQLDDFVQSNVKSIIAIGEDQDNIFNHFAAMKTVKKADSMKEAIQQATDQASVGEIVLFSPACKSFDMYTNFEERGQEFKKEVNSLVD